jgi:hypothetical protein
MAQFKVESFHVFPVCVDRTSPTPAPPNRANPFSQAREDRLRDAMSSQVDVDAVEAGLLAMGAIQAPTLAAAAEEAQRRCEKAFQQERENSDGHSVSLHIDPAAYIPVGGGRHESSCWACLVNDANPTVKLPWSFPLNESDQERYDAYVCVRLSLVPQT